MKFKLQTIAICLMLIILPSTVWALEVGFPNIANVGIGDSAGPLDWIRYIFLLSQALVGLAIIYAFVRAGILWMTARDNQGQVGDAKKWMTGAVWGLIILLGSYIFLNTINPQLVNLRTTSIQYGEIQNPLGFFGGRELGEKCNNGFQCKSGVCKNDVCGGGQGLGSDQGSCENETSCSGIVVHCLDNTTGTVIPENIKGSGTCTSKQATGEACGSIPNGTVVQCFIGTCTGGDPGKCVLNGSHTQGVQQTPGTCGKGTSCPTSTDAYPVRCLDTNTGDLITNPTDASSANGTCTKKGTWGDTCNDTSDNSQCFKGGTCDNGTCVKK